MRNLANENALNLLVFWDFVIRLIYITLALLVFWDFVIRLINITLSLLVVQDV